MILKIDFKLIRKTKKLAAQATSFFFRFRIASELSTQTKSLDQSTITLDVALLHVAKQFAALTDEHRQRTSRSVVFVIFLEVLSEVSNAVGEQRHLTFDRTCVLCVLAEFLEDFSLLFFA